MIYEILEQVRNTNSKNEKIQILQDNKENIALKDYLYQTYSNQINFYMRKIPAIPKVGDGGSAFFTALFPVIADALSTRKVTGNAAAETVVHAMVALDEKHQKLLSWMLLKDVKAGFNVSTINKVWPGLIFEPGYMRCSLETDANFDKWEFDSTDGHLVQLKADGMFVNVIVNDDGVTFMSRQGSVFPKGVLGWVENAVEGLTNGFVYMGELTVARLTHDEVALLPRQEGNGILNSALQGTEVPSPYVVKLDLWDAVQQQHWYDGKDDTPYWIRYEELCGDVFDLESKVVQVIETRDVTSLEEAKEITREWMKLGFEGAVLKHSQMPWKDHTSKFQIKIKAAVDVELRADALVAGDETSQHSDLFGSIRCSSSCGQLVVDVPGYSKEHRQHIFDHWEELYKGKIMTARGNVVLFPGKTRALHSIFLPRHIEWRFDKTEADSLEQIIKQFDNSGV